jgi:ribonuclease P protein component
VAYAVSRRVGPAVVRNRVRRRLRHAVAEHRQLLVPGGAYLVIPRPGVAETPYAELSRWVAELLGAVPGSPSPAPSPSKASR